MKRNDGITVDGCGMFCGTVFDGSATKQDVDRAMGTLLSKVSSAEDSLLGCLTLVGQNDEVSFNSYLPGLRASNAH